MSTGSALPLTMLKIAVSCIALGSAMDAASASAATNTAAHAAVAVVRAAAAAQIPGYGTGHDPQAAAQDMAQRFGVELVECQCERGLEDTVVVVRRTVTLSFLRVGLGHATSTARVRHGACRIFDPPPAPQGADPPGACR